MTSDTQLIQGWLEHDLVRPSLDMLVEAWREVSGPQQELAEQLRIMVETQSNKPETMTSIDLNNVDWDYLAERFGATDGSQPQA